MHAHICPSDCFFLLDNWTIFGFESYFNRKQIGAPGCLILLQKRMFFFKSLLDLLTQRNSKFSDDLPEWCEGTMVFPVAMRPKRHLERTVRPNYPFAAQKAFAAQKVNPC
jgi:hypothetical protein